VSPKARPGREPLPSPRHDLARTRGEALPSPCTSPPQQLSSPGGGGADSGGASFRVRAWAGRGGGRGSLPRSLPPAGAEVARRVGAPGGPPEAPQPLGLLPAPGMNPAGQPQSGSGAGPGREVVLVGGPPAALRGRLRGERPQLRQGGSAALRSPAVASSRPRSHTVRSPRQLARVVVSQRVARASPRVRSGACRGDGRGPSRVEAWACARGGVCGSVVGGAGCVAGLRLSGVHQGGVRPAR